MLDARDCLNDHECDAAFSLLCRATARGDAELVRAILFGSRARGDHDEASDIDLLLVFAVPPDRRRALARWVDRVAREIVAREDVPLQPWTLGIHDLAPGCRTPMLVDALEDGLPLWPEGAPPLKLPFTPADARFCARRLLEWVDEGGPTARAALDQGRLPDAARRIRDDITRMATAALLLTGDTRHRRTGSLVLFAERLMGRYGLGRASAPALEWAAHAYPPDDGRGTHAPPVAHAAIATADLGYRFAAAMEREVVPWIARQL